MGCKYCKGERYLLDFANNTVIIKDFELVLQKFVDETLEYEEVEQIYIKFCPMCGEKLI